MTPLQQYNLPPTKIKILDPPPAKTFLKFLTCAKLEGKGGGGVHAMLRLIKFKCCSLMFENVLAKFKVECAFKYLSAAEHNFIEKIRIKNAVSFLHEKFFFIMQLENFQTNKNKISSFFEDLNFLNPRSHFKHLSIT